MPVLSRVILTSPFSCMLIATTGIFICLSVSTFAQEVVINVEGNPNLRQVVRVNSTITALNSNVSSPSADSNTTALANSTTVNSTLTNSTVSGNLTTTNTTSVNGTTTNSTTSGNTGAIVVPPDSSSSINSTITNTNGTTPAANTSLSSVNTNATAGANLTSSGTTNNNTAIVNGTSSSANSTTISTAVTTTNTTASNVTTNANGTTNGTNANGTSISTVTSSNTTTISANGTSVVNSANGTTTNGTGLNVTNTTTASSNNTSGNTTANGAGTSSTNATTNNSTLPVISASAATNRSLDGAATLPSVFILGAASTTPTAAQTTTPASTVNTPIPTTLTTTATVAPSTTIVTTPTTPTTPTTVVTTTPTTAGPTASSVLVTPSIRNDSTRPSIVVNIDIDLGSPHPTDASNTSPTPTTVAINTISPSTPPATTPLTTNVPGQVTTTPSGNIPFTPPAGTPVIPNGLSTLTPTTSVPPSKPTLEELVANKNGTQVVCFSLPFDLLEKLLPLISSLGINPNSVTTPPPSPSSPLYNPLTSAPTQPPATVPGASTITPGTPPNGNYPFLGPFGAGSYGGFRPTVPPQPTYAVTAATTTTSRPMNPYPVMPSQQVMQPAGVIPYYTYAPGTGSHYANAQPAVNSGYRGSSISLPAYPLTYDKPAMAASGSYGETLAQAPAQAVISTVDGAVAPLQSPKGVSVLESKALTRGPLASPLNRQPSEANLPAWCTNNNLVPDAITVTADGLTHVFIGNQVFSVKNASSADKKVVQNPIQKIWRGLPADVGRINGATTRPDGTTYLFSGPSYWKFDSLYRVARDSPRKTSIGFPGVAQMDAVYQDLLSDGDMSFLQGPGYFTYNHKKFPPYQGPASLSDLGLPSEVTKVDAAFTDPATRDLFFVAGSAMYRVSPTNNGLAKSYKMLPGYPKPFRTLFGCLNL